MSDLRLRPGWVVLTTGSRPSALAAAIDSIREQVPGGPVVVVAQGIDVVVPDGVEVVRLDENVGIPGGRDVGLRATDADVVFFLDDDATYVTPHVAADVLAAFAQDATLAAVSLRVVDDHGETMRRHVPRIGTHSADRPGRVTSFLGGACAVRRNAYLAAGGFEASFFYGHEEMDLAWRMLDAGGVIEYLARPAVVHPRVPVEHGGADRWRLLGRNRVWLARRRLPHPVDWVHAAVWLAGGLVRAGSARRSYWEGWRTGWAGPVERRPISWATVVRMMRAGRPPIV